MGTVILIVLLAVLFLFVLPAIVLSGVLYTVLLVRTKPEKWDRSCSMPQDPEYQRMFDLGIEWGTRYADKKRDVSVTSDGLKLAGEYFDFGFDRAVIIIPGRMESCLYSYFFSEPYRAAGYNILAIDNRSHGNSQGKISSLGYREYRDILTWSRFLHDQCGVSRVVLHGICIGASCGLFAATDRSCPEYVDALVADGMYVNFFESFKNHMIEDKRPMFPFLWLVMGYIRVVSGANVVTDGPLWRIGGMKKPVLFLHSREDRYSLPEKAEELYAACPAEKELVWFDHGAHSRLRINDPARYDRAIGDFLRSRSAPPPDAQLSASFPTSLR